MEAGRGVIPGARFVDPSILARIGNLELLARTVVDGFINGLHRAPYFGASIDFAEHRGYVSGDDIRRVHWRLFGISKSMSFGSRGVTKLAYGSYRGACLAYLAHRQRDRVGMITFDDDIVNYVPSSAKHFNVLLHTLDRAKAERRGNLTKPLKDMAEHFKRRSILVLISDFYEDPDAILEAVKPLRFQGSELIVFHVLDPAELDFGYQDASSFEDLESGEQIPVVPDSFAVEYRKLIRAHIDTLTTKFSEHRIDYTLVNTAEPLDRLLSSY